MWMLKKSQRYNGTFITLQGNNKILKSILKQPGSQWREARTGDRFSCFLLPVKRPGAACWQYRDDLFKAAYKALQ